MGLLGGATSLVELIVKKFGDDIDGATQELVRMGGFPEPVARRIATGELPMDEASRVARREAQTHPEDYIHGSKTGGILEIDPEKSGGTNPNARGSGFWGSDNPYQAGTYTGALGEGGTLYPFRVKRGEQIDVDLNGSHWNNIDTEARITSNGEDYGSIEGWDDTAYDTNDLAFMFQGAGADSLLMRNTIDTAADGNINVVFEEMFPELQKMPHGSKERYEFKKAISKEDFQKAKDIANERSARPSNNVAVFSENNIRSPNAAFDPQYTGPNIMGGAALPVAAGLLAAGQSDDADAGFITKGGKTLLEAWHGSPHKFDKFSMDAIGTGEGVQQYGHGLYFADDIDTAKGFQPRDPDHEQWMYEQYKASEDSGDQYMMDAWERAMMHESPIELRASAADPDYDEYSQAAFAEVADALTANPGAGSLSKVEIDVTPESLLDYDKPLGEQSDLVQSFFAGREGIGPDTSGRALSESLLGGREPGLSLKELNKIASEEMNEAGINGLQYQDWVNQASGSDLRNYVIFDDSLINIAERGNADPRLLAGIAGTTAAGLAAPMIKDSGMISAPRSETLFDLTMGARDIERRLEGSPASLLFPSGLVEYLETVNRREEDPNAMTRGMALLDVLPF